MPRRRSPKRRSPKRRSQSRKSPRRKLQSRRKSPRRKLKSKKKSRMLNPNALEWTPDNPYNANQLPLNTRMTDEELKLFNQLSDEIEDEARGFSLQNVPSELYPYIQSKLIAGDLHNLRVAFPRMGHIRTYYVKHLNNRTIRRAVAIWIYADLSPEKDEILEKYGHISDWDVSMVTDMSNLFANFVEPFNEDISGWNTSHVTNMSGMFEKCEFFNLPAVIKVRLDRTAVAQMLTQFFIRGGA